MGVAGKNLPQCHQHPVARDRYDKWRAQAAAKSG
eukprot:COSAG02_NODE_15891_length_1132_cov_16.913843_1_plen_33_part_10